MFARRLLVCRDLGSAPSISAGDLPGCRTTPLRLAGAGRDDDLHRLVPAGSDEQGERGRCAGDDKGASYPLAALRVSGEFERVREQFDVVPVRGGAIASTAELMSSPSGLLSQVPS
jgi:hypothetical protein